MRRALATLGFAIWLSLAEWKVLERIFFFDPASTGFVVESVRGVLAGTPVSKSWQHRFVGPLLVSALGGANTDALERFGALATLGANLLLLVALWKRKDALLAVVCLGLAHFVLAYKLEYPWDGVDQILFVAFGVWAADGRGLAKLAPLLLVGAFNHETILYVPLWYLLSRDLRERLVAGAAAIAIGAAIFVTRTLFYKGQPELAGQVFETPTPLVGNHLHVAHNLRALFVDDWGAGRAHISIGFLGAVFGLAWLAVKGPLRQAAIWSLVVLATVVCFGYVNETRHYLVPAAFWIAYLWRRSPIRTLD